MTVFRRGGQRDLNVVVAELEPERPQPVAQAPQAAPPTSSGPAQALGLSLGFLPTMKPQLSQLPLIVG
jgi:serine protease Do